MGSLIVEWACSDRMGMYVGVESETMHEESRKEPVIAARWKGDRVLAEWLTEAAAMVVEVEEARACVVSSWEGCRRGKRINRRGAG